MAETRVARMHANDGLFPILAFDHLEFVCCDALSTAKYLKNAFGLAFIAKTNRDTNNFRYSSYVLRSGTVKFIVTAPYVSEIQFEEAARHKQPNPKYDTEQEKHFYTTHGTGVKTIGVRVPDATEAYHVALSKGATGVVEPTEILAEGGGRVVMSEIRLYDDADFDAILAHMPDVYEGIQPFRSNTTLRFLTFDNFDGPYLPGYVEFKDPHPLNYGLARIDHVVGNVYRMSKVCEDIKTWTGFHTFAFFTPDQIKTDYTSLNSEVLASDDAQVLMPINEAAPGKKESQILKYLRAYQGPGVQHIAIKTPNIFASIESMVNTPFGVDFLFTPDSYYDRPEIMDRIKCLATEHANPYKNDINVLKEELMRFRILVDQDEDGILLQIFTKPLFDRPTLFVEIIQRICHGDEVPGCGKFGQGNFKALFETLELYFDGKSANKQ